jgi:hypothetical protein
LAKEVRDWVYVNVSPFAEEIEGGKEGGSYGGGGEGIGRKSHQTRIHLRPLQRRIRPHPPINAQARTLRFNSKKRRLPPHQRHTAGWRKTAISGNSKIAEIPSDA